MKTFFRIAVILFLLVLVVLAGTYLTLTNAGFQKGLVERQLPAGSSIESIHVTASKVTLTGLVWILEDGTRVQIESLDTPFKLLAAVFDQTIKAGLVQVEGLRVDLPAVVEPNASSRASTDSLDDPPADDMPDTLSVAESPPANPIEWLVAMGDFEWLFDIDGIDLEGVIYDGRAAQCNLRVGSAAIRPGQASQIEASLQLLADAPLPSGLRAIDASATLSFKQQANGGFDSLQLESNLVGNDLNGGRVVAVQQSLDLEVDDTLGEEATVSLRFAADLPKPQVVVPNLAPLGALAVSGNAVASIDGEKVTLSAGHLVVSAAGAELVALNLKRRIVFGAQQEKSGEWLEASVTAFQLEWLNPWLSNGLQIHSQAPVSLMLSVADTVDGAFTITAVEPLQLGPLAVSESGVPLLEEITVQVLPELQLNAEQSLAYALNSLSVADQYGAFIQGSASGLIQLEAARGAADPFAGLQAQAKLQIGLQEVFQLPMFARCASIFSGQLELDLNVDGSADAPLELQAKIQGLRARTIPNIIKDYSVTLRLNKMRNPKEWRIDADLLAGPVSRPSTSLQLAATLDSDSKPLRFSADLSGPLVNQEDISVLAAALSPREEATPKPSLPGEARRGALTLSSATRSKAMKTSSPVPPAWAMLDGDVVVKIDEFRLEAGQVIEAITLQADVSEPRLMVDPISAKIGGGEFKGNGMVEYVFFELKPYNLTADFHCTDVNPAVFVKRQQTAPLQGRFDGAFEMIGVGDTLEAAIEDSSATLKVTSEQGVLTAFELDERRQLGLGLAGLLGQSLDRPGIAALSQTIPYFKEIRFNDFAFELTRGADKRVLVPQLRLEGESILIDASGSVGASRLDDILDQPLDLVLSLSAKGRLTEYLAILNLLQPAVGEDGFTRWNQDIEITGTLTDPDTGALMDILNDAAKDAFSKPSKREQRTEETAPIDPLPAALLPQGDGTSQAAIESEEPQEKSKKQRRRDEIEMGLDLINSLFGN
jgi:hypothetical protein